MNTYSRALRHINMKDVKQKHQQKFIEQKIQEENQEKQERYVASVMEEKKYNWRNPSGA
jgi:phosphoribosylformylglycinamidine (FGAM) synthase PurS component